MFYKVELAVSSPTSLPWPSSHAGQLLLGLLSSPVGHTNQAQRFKMLDTKEIRMQPQF